MLPALSKKQKKLADAWALNIKAKLDKGYIEGEDIAAYIDGLAKTNLPVLQNALHNSYPFDSCDSDITLLELAAVFGLIYQGNSRGKLAIIALPHLLKHAMHPSQQVNEALLFFYDCFKKQYLSFKVTDMENAKQILKIFLIYPDTWNVKSRDSDTLAHIAVLMGDIELLKKALAFNKEWLEHKNNDLQETLLYTATRYKQDAIAKVLIEEYNADINSINSVDLNVLANAIFFHSAATIELLLSKGCSINAFTNVVINEDSLKSCSVLMSSGYFLPSSHREPINSKIVSTYLNIPPEKMLKPMFYLISKDDKKKIELISSAEELKASTLIPSENQRQRLMLSFQETMLYDKGDELRLLFETFKEKFGKECSHKPIAYYDAKDPNLRQFSFSKIINEGLKNANNIDYAAMLIAILKIVTRPHNLRDLSAEELKLTLVEFSESLTLATAYIEANPNCEIFSELTYLTAYKYFKHMLPRVAAISDRNFFITQEFGFINIICLAANHILSDIDKHEVRAIATINYVLLRFKSENVTGDVIHLLEIIKEFINIHSYTKAEFYTELLNSVEAIKLNRNSIKSKHSKLDSDYNVTASYIICLSNFKPNVYYLKEQVAIILSIKNYLQAQPNKDNDQWRTLNSLADKRSHEMHAQYSQLLTLIETPCIECTAGDDNHSLIFNFPDHFDKRKVKLLMDDMIRSFPEFKRVGNTYKLYYYGMSWLDLDAVILEFKKIQAPSLLPDATIDSASASEDTKPLPEPKNYYLPPPEICTSRPITHAYRRHVSEGDLQTQHMTPPAPDTKLSPDEIKHEIRTKLALTADAELYSMIHPRYPDSRQHLCWGVWLPRSMENRPESISDEMLERHHALLKNQAKLEIHACGENGFKATEIMNLETGKSESSYKTKRAKENLRIIAVPYQVTLSTQEKASIYCFGLIDMHDKNIAEVDPRAFLQKYSNKPQHSANQLKS